MKATRSATGPTVFEVANAIDGALRELGGGWVEGEVRSINRHRRGHVYLTLGDEAANIDACIWRGRVSRCEPLPKQGDLVQAHYERANFYAPYGKTSLLVDFLKPTGEGELLRRRADTLKRLQAEGLCDRRKPLRAFPRRVGVIAGQDSQAKGDVVRHLRERFRAQEIVFCPAAVQGVDAVGTLIDALGKLQAVTDVDVIIVARGGGSVADLVPFDDERLCRAIVACAVPVITSIGHTNDRPNCDHVAAAYAPVPAKAAELAIRHSADDLLGDLDRHCQALDTVPVSVRRRAESVAALWERIRPRQRVAGLADDVRHAGSLLASRAENLHGRRNSGLVAVGRTLDGCGSKLQLPASLDAVRGRLEEAATAFITGQREAIDAHGASLHAARGRHPGPEALDVLGAHLQNLQARMRAKRRDYTRAVDRLADAAVKDTRRRLTGAARDVDVGTRQLRPAADRVTDRYAERIAHLAALIHAKDFRRRGWVLASDERGQAVRTVAELRVGDAVHLRFADGEAAATVDDLTPDHQGGAS